LKKICACNFTERSLILCPLQERIRREAYLTNEIIIRTELLKAKGQLDQGGEEDNGDATGGGGGDVGRWQEGEDGDSEDSACLSRRRRRRRWSIERKNSGLKRKETGDITDGKIVV